MGEEIIIHRSDCKGGEITEEFRPFDSKKDMRVDVCSGCRVAVMRGWVARSINGREARAESGS